MNDATLKLAVESVNNQLKNGRVCPNDTNGDGDCGRPACPVCGAGMSDPVPLEVSDPELAEHFRLVANGIHPVIHRMSLHAEANVYVIHSGRVVQFKHKMPERNDPCHCGSGKKFKKCHGR